MLALDKEQIRREASKVMLASEHVGRCPGAIPAALALQQQYCKAQGRLLSRTSSSCKQRGRGDATHPVEFTSSKMFASPSPKRMCKGSERTSSRQTPHVQGKHQGLSLGGFFFTRCSHAAPENLNIGTADIHPPSKPLSLNPLTAHRRCVFSRAQIKKCCKMSLAGRCNRSPIRGQ